MRLNQICGSWKKGGRSPGNTGLRPQESGYPILNHDTSATRVEMTDTRQVRAAILSCLEDDRVVPMKRLVDATRLREPDLMRGLHALEAEGDIEVLRPVRTRSTNPVSHTVRPARAQVFYRLKRPDDQDYLWQQRL